MSAGVRIHIQRLVLDPAFAHLDRATVRAAVEAELARLLAEEGAPPSPSLRGRVPRVDGGRFELAAGAGAEAVGSQVARAVYGGLGR